MKSLGRILLIFVVALVLTQLWGLAQNQKVPLIEGARLAFPAAQQILSPDKINAEALSYIEKQGWVNTAAPSQKDVSKIIQAAPSDLKGSNAADWGIKILNTPISAGVVPLSEESLDVYKAAMWDILLRGGSEIFRELIKTVLVSIILGLMSPLWSFHHRQAV